MGRLSCLNLLIGIVAGCLSVTAQAQSYTEVFDDGSNPRQVFGGNLLFGNDGAWFGEIRAGQYHLSNKSNPGAVRFYYIEATSKDGSPLGEDFRIGVDVGVENGGQIAGSGLMYSFDERENTYFAFVLTDDATFGLYFRGPDGFNPIASGPHDAIGRGSSNRLSVQISADRAELFINGASLGSHEATDMSQGAIGIIAMDTGDFTFDNFQLRYE